MPEFLKKWLKIKKNEVDYLSKKTGKRVKYTEYIADHYRLHLLRSLSKSRFTGTVVSILDEKQTPIAKMIKYTTDIKIYQIDVQRTEELEIKDYMREIE